MLFLREPIILSCMLVLAAIGWVYGWKFFKLKNDILGFEWWLIGFSASCFFIFRTTGQEAAGATTLFLDQFSRLLGVPVIGALGVLQITHGLHFSRLQEVLMFVVGMLVSAAFSVFEPLKAMLPVLFLVFGLAFFALIAFMAWQAFKRGLRLHGWLMVISVLMNVGVALLQDFVKFADDATSVLMNQLVIEHVVWSYGCSVMYYCYRAMHNHQLAQPPAQTRGDAR